MAAPRRDLSGRLTERLTEASPDLLREMLRPFIDALMSADAGAVSGAPYGARSDERMNTRDGYRRRDWRMERLVGTLGIDRMSKSQVRRWLRPRRAGRRVVPLAG